MHSMRDIKEPQILGFPMLLEVIESNFKTSSLEIPLKEASIPFRRFNSSSTDEIK